MRVVGIDPGLSGGLAFLDGTQASADPMPTIGKGKDRFLDVEELSNWIKFRAPELIVLERVNAIPGASAGSSFKFGGVYWTTYSIATLLRRPLLQVTPKQWQDRILGGTSRDKSVAMRVCRDLFPGCSIEVNGSQHDGLSDALCIAEYGRRERRV